MNDPQLLRYSRQILLPQIEFAGQQRLLAARVLILGVGGLGVAAATYLATAGVGALTLIDFDRIELTNLQRQPLYREEDIGARKVEVAAERLRWLNPDLKVVAQAVRADAPLLTALIPQHDLVLDCSDNFATRFLLNEACYHQQKPLVSGAATAFAGQVTLFDYQPHSPCYRCLYPDEGGEEPGCQAVGVVAPLVGVIGSLQALEAIKWITGAGQTLAGRLLLVDALTQEWRTLRLRPDPACPLCGVGTPT